MVCFTFQISDSAMIVYTLPKISLDQPLVLYVGQVLTHITSRELHILNDRSFKAMAPVLLVTGRYAYLTLPSLDNSYLNTFI